MDAFESFNWRNTLVYEMNRMTVGEVGPIFAYKSLEAARKCLRIWAKLDPVVLLGVESTPVTRWRDHKEFSRRYGVSNPGRGVAFVKGVTPVVLIDHLADVNNWRWDGAKYVRKARY